MQHYDDEERGGEAVRGRQAGDQKQDKQATLANHKQENKQTNKMYICLYIQIKSNKFKLNKLYIFLGGRTGKG